MFFNLLSFRQREILGIIYSFSVQTATEASNTNNYNIPVYDNFPL